ncbi:hypothetical protein BU23DRAFT_435644, partial [Bimuria novae-zelandiae CBS 107.79]
ITCAFSSLIPSPPTDLQSCAVPIGGSNSTLLDTCCNGEVNPIRTFPAPDADHECYMYCTTDDAAPVQTCLEQNLGRYVKGGGQAFQCF